ncbi:hypothetical protein Y032_0301g1828 [Ancylostoma ceylanicum]|uniref:Uncharacterized protein n=1 Tax=Ancylostoma ceylanicum TaxID=53326 RepID=A0A016S470_9BILA|nr:hypothetical protein Y032_0301g1828 [Ancylostoma ceylanicum]
MLRSATKQPLSLKNGSTKKVAESKKTRSVQDLARGWCGKICKTSSRSAEMKILSKRMLCSTTSIDTGLQQDNEHLGSNLETNLILLAQYYCFRAIMKLDNPKCMMDSISQVQAECHDGSRFLPGHAHVLWMWHSLQ